MSDFEAIIGHIEQSPVVDDLLARIREGSAEERDAALNELLQTAEARNDLASWNAAGIGFHFARKNDRAAQIFENLVKNAPDQDVCRLNLATCYSQIQEIALCRHHLLHLAEQGSTADMRRLGREQLEGYDAFLGNTDRDRKLRSAQIRSLRAAVASEQRSADDFVKLAGLLQRARTLNPNEHSEEELVDVLVKGHEAFPKEAHILELLVFCYLRHDPHGRLHQSLKLLERISPDSKVLRMMAEQDDREAREFSENIMRRADGLLRTVFEGAPPVRQAALDDLAAIVAAYPANPHYRLDYAFALMVVGQSALALKEATRSAESEVAAHSFHFNLGQVFWGSGDPSSGRKHLKLALDYATTDEERNDVLERIADLESRTR